ncbi:MAG: serine/threonine-protein kinase [Roseiflexus sp.]|nr:serine/threonine-protein kinase [Roseiflexus sp.]MCS7290503.1 serine/threonine-protein kinase [Roseiflexus sp.]MDW8148356.1 serine/threonine-protein kinase [Roseiflexaceae bacterium]MDW8232290.1 serine/threonine-protein kinase [Roseiflexaceae bacterium]
MALIKKPGTTKGIDLNSSSSNAGSDQQGTATPGAGAHAAAPVMQPGVILQGRYVIEGTLGIGGMSVVYRGRDLRFKDVIRPCAIKEMYQSAPDSNTRLLNLKNFEREAGLLATLQHPAIPKVFDFFEENGRVYLILELIQGKDLETILDEAKGPLPEERVARWAVQLCEVLSYLHNQKPEPIVFRDMKPSNVMVTPDDRIVLIDFGIARSLARTRGTIIGTEGYSPPEQYKGIAEPQSDLYALGATLHHLLTASDPRTETPFTFHERPLRQLNPQVSPELAAVVEKALSYDMKTRWASAEEMRLALLQTPTLRAGQSGGMAAAGKVALPRVSSVATTELVWRFVCEDEVRSSPCVSNGMVFVGCYDTNLYAIDASRGEFRWKYATEGGISSSPAVWNDIVIVGSEDGAVYACDIRRGTLRWTFRTGKPVRSSPRVLDRVIFIGSDDQHFYAIDGLRGAQIWKYRTWMPIRSSACIAGESVYFGGGDGFVYALNIKNGSVRWKQRTQQPVISSPAFAENMVIVGSMDNTLYALDSEGGWPVWKYRTNHYVNSSPFVFGTRVFVGSVDGNLYAIELKNGKLAWKYDTGSQITSSPRVDQGRVYFGAADGCVYCLDAANGALIWRYETQGPVVSSPAISEGMVYIGSLDHALYALRA